VLWNAAVVDPLSITDQTIMVMDAGLYDYHIACQLPTLAYSSQANGLFERMSKGTVDQMNPSSRRAYPFQANQARYERIRSVAYENNLTINQVVLGFLISQPFPVFPIIGPKRMDQLIESLNSTGVTLTYQQIAFILG
jgi:aryl-alcohol dehydrogenase-like predicted oxidoreductase